jgi:hypothetical protein
MDPGIPSVVSEYGASRGWVRPGKLDPGRGELQNEQFNWRSGESLWCAFDYGSHQGDLIGKGMIDYFRLPKNRYYWYRNEYRHIAPPVPTKDGIPAKLLLTADKTTISNTDGTDDVHLIVTVLDKDGSPLSNCPEVTLKLVSGSGEFPTGSSITFKDSSDIYIRDGKAAIEFRSYYGGKSVIKATSPGLQDGQITIETKGLPAYVEGKSLKTEERPYKRFKMKKTATANDKKVNIAPLKPTGSSSSAQGFNGSLANDQDTTTAWQAKQNEVNSWWQLYLEHVYILSDLKLIFPSEGNYRYKIEISEDGSTWKTAFDERKTTGIEKIRTHLFIGEIKVNLIRITFTGLPEGKPASLAEMEVYGKSIAQ